MKTTIALIVLIFFPLMAINSQTSSTNPKNELTATYKGMTKDGKYSFTNAKGEIVLFNKIAEEVKINLSDKKALDKKFIITWKFKVIEILSYEGEPEESVTIKLITELKYVE